MSNERKVTICDIAEYCHVAPSTVSRVLNGNQRISDATREAVLDAAHALGYVPNMYAQSLRSRSVQLVGIFINAVTPAFETSARLLSILLDDLTAAGYTPFICVTGVHAEQESYYYQKMLSLNACAIFKILNCTDPEIDRISTIPIIYLYRYPLKAQEDSRVCRIETDNYSAGYQAGIELIRQGCRRIAEIRLVSKVNGFPFARHLGLMQALFDHDIPYDEELSVICPVYDYGALLTQVDQVLEAAPAADGYFCSSDLNALALEESLIRHGYSIPDQVKIIGCNDMSVSLHSFKPISTISHRWEELCRTGVDVMRAILSGRELTPEERHQIFPTYFIPRKTTI